MITINSFDKKITDNDVRTLSRHFSELCNQDIDISISFHENRKMPYHATSGVIIDDSRFKSSFKNTVSSSESFIDAIEKTIESHLMYASCKHGDLKPHITREGVLVTNGVLECGACGMLTHPSNTHIGENQKTIMLSAFGQYKERYYTTRFDWQGISIQGGDCGVVISTSNAKAYSTAFFEAFPTIKGIKTFIRGEGVSLIEAERDAYEQLNKQKNCIEHVWDRVDGRSERNDGYATCRKCGLSGHALEPSTLCTICRSPTKLSNLDLYYCETHYNQLSFDELYENDVRFNTERLLDPDSPVPIETDSELKSENFECFLRNKFYVLLREHGLASGTLLSKEKMDYLTITFIQFVKTNVFGIECYRNFTYIPDTTTPVFLKNMDRLKQNIPEFLLKEANGEHSAFELLLNGWDDAKHPQINTMQCDNPV